MENTLSEGTIIGATAFTVVPIDGSCGSCLFGTISTAIDDGTSVEGLRQTVAVAARRHADCRVQFGGSVWRVGELTQLLADKSAHAYALELATLGDLHRKLGGARLWRGN